MRGGCWEEAREEIGAVDGVGLRGKENKERNMAKKEVEDILRKYGERLEREVESETSALQEEVRGFTSEYVQFKRESFRVASLYERLCRAFSFVLKINPSPRDKARLAVALETTHLEITPIEALSFSVNLLILGLIISIGGFVAYFLITGNFLFLFLLLGLVFSIFLFYYVYNFPFILAKKWQLKASSQLVPALLYMVIYMKHTPNLERAVKFASDHLQPPLALDFKKIFWDVETGRFSSVRESLDAYLEKWRGLNLEFVEAMHLVESSLYEPTEARRVSVLEKSLSVMLEGVQEKMLRYVHDIKSPLTNIYMLGIVLPTLALALLPLGSALLGGLVNWVHVILLFNLIIPFFVYYLTSQVLLQRPGGYGETELLELNPDYVSYKSNSSVLVGLLIALPLLLLGLSPLLLHYTLLGSYFGISDGTLPIIGKFFDFKDVGGASVGPFGVGALLLSLLVPLSAALFFGVVYRLKTEKLIKTREETKKLESEFSSSLFQLGNRLGAGVPVEMAFGRVASILGATPTGKFFSLVNINIQNGMSVHKSIFSKARGALSYYPSSLIRTSMHILVESAKKGLKIASRSVIAISEYSKNIHRIDERLRDMLADVVVSMKSNISFLAPILSGIVIGLAAMITLIINKLAEQLSGVAGGGVGEAGLGVAGTGSLVTLFQIESMIPPYFLQLAVGLYLVEIIFILTSAIVIVESGTDKLTEKYEISKGLYKGIFLYIVIALLAILLLAFLASLVIQQVGGF